MAPPHPRSTKFAKLSKREQRRRIAEGVSSGRMSADEGEAAAKFWKLGSIADKGGGSSVPSLGKAVGGMFGIGDRDDGEIRPDRDLMRKWRQKDAGSLRRKEIDSYTPPPRPLPSLARNPDYKDYFEGQEANLRSAGDDEKLSSAQLMKKYGGFRSASMARGRSQRARDLERKLAKGEALARYDSLRAGKYDVMGQGLVIGAENVPFLSDNWKEDLRQMAAGAVPSALQFGAALGEDLALKPFRMIAGSEGAEDIKTWEKIAKPMLKQYQETYLEGVKGDPSTWTNIVKNWKQNYKEHPLFATLDAAAVIAPTARLAGIGKLAFTRPGGPDAAVGADRLGVIKAWQESFRPGTHDVLTRTLETKSGKQIPAPVWRGPIARSASRALDTAGAKTMFGQPNPLSRVPGISQQRRAAKLQGKQFLKADMKRAAIDAKTAFETVIDFTGGDPGILEKIKLMRPAELEKYAMETTARETALFHAAQGPEGNPIGMIEAVLSDLRTMRDNPEEWDIPDRADSDTLQRLDREIEKLQKQYDKAMEKGGMSDLDRALAEDKTQIRKARGSWSALRLKAAELPDGPEKVAAEAQVAEAHNELVNRQASLALKRGGKVVPVTNSPERDALLTAFKKVGGEYMIQMYDSMARAMRPLDPQGWYRDTNFTALEDPDAMFADLSQAEALFHIPNFHLRATLILDKIPDQGRKRSFMEWNNILRGRGIKKPEIVGMERALADMRSEGMKSVTPGELKKRIEEKAMIPDEQVVPGERFPEYTLDGVRSDEMTYLWTFDPERWGIRHEEHESHFANKVKEGANIIAWARTNIRKTKDGKWVLFIEEIQSDWAQGFKAKATTFEALGRAIEAVDLAEAELARVNKAHGYGEAATKPRHQLSPQDQRRTGAAEEVPDEVVEARENLSAAVKKKDAAKKAYNEHADTEPGPYMETDQYVTLVVDRLMKEAARDGLDGVAWTTGAQQRARYNKQTRTEIKDLEWKPKTGEIIAHGHVGTRRVLDSGKMDYDDLKAVMGPDGAKQFTDRHRNDPGMESIILPAEGIDVGSAIHDFVYDNVSPRVVAAAGKEHGQKVGTTDLVTSQTYDPVQAREVWEEAFGDEFPIYVRDDGDGWFTLWNSDLDEPWIDDPDTGSISAVSPEKARQYLNGATDRLVQKMLNQEGREGWYDPSEIEVFKRTLAKRGAGTEVTEAVHHLPLPKKIHKKVQEQQFTYYRHQIPGEELPRGAFQLMKDKSTRLRLSTLANEETLAHELLHVGFHDLTPEDQATLAAKRGKTVNTLDESDHEAFAQWWIDWMRTGKAPNKSLEAIFFKFRDWMRRVYGALKGLDELDPETERVFQKMLGYEGLDVTDQFDSEIGGLGPALTQGERLGVILSQKKGERQTAQTRQDAARAQQTDEALQRRVKKEVEKATEAEVSGDIITAEAHWNEAKNLAFRLSMRKYNTMERQENRVALLKGQIRALENVLDGTVSFDPAQMDAALDSMEFLVDDRERMIREAIPAAAPILEERDNLVTDRLVEKGYLPEGAGPSRMTLPHRSNDYWKTMSENLTREAQARGQSKRHKTTSRPSQTELGLHVRNRLFRWQSGDLLPDPAVALDAHQAALVYYHSFRARVELYGEGDPVTLNAHKTGSLNDGWYLVKDPSQNTEIPREMREFQLLTPEAKAEQVLRMTVEGGTDPNVLLENVADYNRQWIAEIKDGSITHLDPNFAIGNFLNEDGTLLNGVRQVPPWIVKSYLRDPSLKETATGWMRETADIGNALARIALITTNPGYIPANIGGNLVFLFATAGPQLFGAFKDYSTLLVSKSNADRRTFAGIKGQIGTGHLASQSMRSEVATRAERKLKGGEGFASRWIDPRNAIRNIPEANVYLSEKLGPIADDPWRMIAWLEEARRRKYRDRAAWDRLLNAKPGTREARDLMQIRADSNSRMVDFDRLADWEKATIGRWIFVYPWLRGATAWMAWYAKNFPERTALWAAGSANFMQASGSNELDLPPYLDMLTNAGGGKLVNYAPISPFSTAYDMYKVGRSTLQGDPNPTEVVGGLLAPHLQLGSEALWRRGTFGQTLDWSDVAEEALGSMVPGGTIAKQMIDPDSISDIYKNKTRSEILLSKVLRFIPREYNKPYLKALADRSGKKEEFAEETYGKMNAISKAAGMEVPTTVKQAYDLHVQYHVRRDVLKEAITKQKDFSRSRVGQATLTPRQELGVLFDVVSDVYSDLSDAPSVAEFTEGMSDEEVESVIRKVESKLGEPRYRWEALGKGFGVKAD